MQQTTIFQHPDGRGTISYDHTARQLVISNEDEGTSTTALIGKVGLRELAEALLKLAEQSECDQVLKQGAMVASS